MPRASNLVPRTCLVPQAAALGAVLLLIATSLDAQQRNPPASVQCGQILSFEVAAQRNFESAIEKEIGRGRVPLEGRHYTPNLTLPDAKFCEIVHGQDGWMVECYWEYKLEEVERARAQYRSMTSMMKTCLPDAKVTPGQGAEQSPTTFERNRVLFEVSFLEKTGSSIEILGPEVSAVQIDVYGPGSF